MVGTAEQNLLSGALGLFLQINGICQNPNRFSQSCFSVKFFVV